MNRLIIIKLLFLISFPVFAQSTFDELLKGKRCKESNQQINCDYKIQDDFWLSIAGIGNPDTGVSFMKSDFNGDYYGTFGALHGCVIVKKGMSNKENNLSDFAFVSPKNGKVYRDWQSCRTQQ